MSQATFQKRQRERQRAERARNKAARKAARAAATEDAPEVEEPSADPEVITKKLESLHAAFDRDEMDLEEFEEAKSALLSQLAF